MLCLLYLIRIDSSGLKIINDKIATKQFEIYPYSIKMADEVGPYHRFSFSYITLIASWYAAYIVRNNTYE